MNATIGGEKPVVNAVQQEAQVVDSRSFIVGYREHSATIVERVIRGEYTNDLDLLVANFVLVLKGVGFDVNLAVNADGDFVIEDNSEVIDVEVEQLEVELDRPFELGDQVLIMDTASDLYDEIKGKVATVVSDPEFDDVWVRVVFESDYSCGWCIESEHLKRISLS